MSDGDDDIIYNDLDDEDEDEDTEWESYQGYNYLFRDRIAKTSLAFVPGQWNDSGVDPSCYVIKIPNHFISIAPDRTYMEYTVSGEERRKHFSLPYVLKLADFIEIIKAPFGLELSDGNMGKFYQYDDYDLDKELQIKIDPEHVKKKILQLSGLKAFI